MSWKVPLFTLRVEDMGDHYQVYKNIPTVKTDRKGKQWVPYRDMGTDIKVGNIWKCKDDQGNISEEHGFNADSGMNDGYFYHKTVEGALSFLLRENEYRKHL